MSDMSRTKTIILIVVGLIAIALIVCAIGRAPSTANAQTAAATGTNPWSVFFHDLIRPFAPRNGTLLGASPLSESSSTGLYQPVDQYESDVMTAVQKASPAVVSITISENVPVIDFRAV
jgi:hypothetical protein